MSRTAVPDPDDHGPGIMQTTWVLTALAIIVTFLRVYGSSVAKRALKWHDWFMVLAMLLQIASQACVTEAYNYGLGIHDRFLIMDPTMPWITMVKLVYVSTVPGVLCSIVARISICLLLISLFGNHRWLKWWLIVTTSLVAVVGIVSIAVTWSQSDPVEGLWNPLLPAKRWHPNISLYVVFVSGAIFALTDLTFVLFPILIIWNLNMKLHRKLGLCILLAGSIFSVATCIMRIITAREQNLFLTAWGMLWASIEQCLVVILGSVPTLPALRKVEIGFVRSLSSSLASLKGRSQVYVNGSRGKGSTGRSTDIGDDMIQLSSREQV